MSQLTCYWWRKKFSGSKTDQLTLREAFWRNSERHSKTVSNLMPEPAPRKMLHYHHPRIWLPNGSCSGAETTRARRILPSIST